MQISTTVEKITPQMAKALLETNVDNRRVHPTKVEQFARDMREGRWALTGQPIIIADDGFLNDGQHRLLAIIAANTSIETNVTRGASRETRDKIDIGTIRTAGDVVQMFHIPNGNSVAALAKIVLSYECGDQKSLGSPYRISRSAVIDRCRNDDKMIAADKFAGSFNNLIPRKQVGFCRYIIPESEKSQEFFDRLLDGAELYTGHPILSLRSWWLRHGRRVAERQGIESILRAWCAFRDGRELQSVRLLQEFPQP
jgi:hypothetical protein